MIEVCQGSPGSGKSAVAVARAMEHLSKGGIVAANFQLVDGWSDVVASHDLKSRLFDSFRYEKSLSLYNRFFYVDSLPAIMQIRPRGLGVGLYKDDGSYSEGTGLLIIDEAQLVFNSRKWNKNFSWIEFFTQHRKLGWNVLLIAHSMEMIDSQIRPLFEYASTFRNLQKVRVPFIGVPVSPIPAFVVIVRYAGLGAGSGSIYSRNVYKLPLWAARLYDSLLVFSEERWLEESSPVLCGNPPSPFYGDGGLIDRLRKWYNLYNFPRPRKSSLASDCLWSRFDDVQEHIVDLSMKDVYPSTWPMSLRD